MDTGPRHQVFKLFIGGLTIETTESDIMNHFSKFGFVFDVLIIRNRETAVSKGYGFISCNNVSTYQRILSTDHIIDGRLIDCHDSFKKNEEPLKFKENANKKIFVGGISLETSDMDLAEYFGQFGPIRQAYVIKDPVSKRSKKFGFAIMKTQESVDKILNTPVHVLKGIVVSCKLFVRLDHHSGKSSHQPANKAGRQEADDQTSLYASISIPRSDGEIFEDSGLQYQNFGLEHYQRESKGSEYLEPEYSDYIDHAEFAEQGSRQPERSFQDDRCSFFSFRARDYSRNQVSNYMADFDNCGRVASEFNSAFSQPRDFGMITDGYVAPMVIDQDGNQGFDQVEFLGSTLVPQEQSFQGYQVGLAASSQTQSPSTAPFNQDRDGQLESSQILADAQGISALPNKEPSGSNQMHHRVNDAVKHQYHIWASSDLRDAKPNKEPPPSHSAASDPQIGDSCQTGYLAALHSSLPADSNIRFNWCSSRRFYSSLRARKPKVF